MRFPCAFYKALFCRGEGKTMRTCPHKITTELASMGNNVNQMNHMIYLTLIVLEHFPLQERAFMCMRLVTNFL